MLLPVSVSSNAIASAELYVRNRSAKSVPSFGVDSGKTKSKKQSRMARPLRFSFSPPGGLNEGFTFL